MMNSKIFIIMLIIGAFLESIGYFTHNIYLYIVGLCIVIPYFIWYASSFLEDHWVYKSKNHPEDIIILQESRSVKIPIREMLSDKESKQFVVVMTILPILILLYMLYSAIIHSEGIWRFVNNVSLISFVIGIDLTISYGWLRYHAYSRRTEI